VQDDIAESVAQAMNVVMNDEKREQMRAAGIRSVEAFVAFQKGFELFDLAHSGKVAIIPTLQEAKEQFDEATRYAPSFGQAYFLKSDYYAHQILTTSSEPEGKEAVRNFQMVLDSAYTNTPDPQQKAIIDFERVLFSDDWRFMDDRIRQVLEEPGCAQPDWFEVAAGFGYQDGVYDVYRRAWECNPLSTLSSHRAAFMALWDGQPDESLQIMEVAIARIGNNSWFSAMKARAYMSLGRFEEARQEASKVMLDEPVFGNTKILVEAAAGNLKKARKLAADRMEIWGNSEITNFQVLVALGHQDQINQLAAEIDDLPGGSGQLASVISSCQCGTPFNLEATPNFRNQLQESGLPWPPPSPIQYPAKDW
jgi:tetratricopeptide (TPR) repeat protein